MVEIRWIGHATFELRTEDGFCLVVDPWYTDSPVATAEAPTDAAFALVTHDHWDHVKDVPQIASAGAHIVLQPETAERIGRAENVDKGAFRTMNLGGRIALREDIHATMIPALHSANSGVAAGYIFEFSGLTVAHLGDTAISGDFSVYGSLYHIDVCLVPIGDVFTMGPGHAAQAIAMLGARTAVPMHYGTFPALVPTADPFVAALKEAAPGASVWAPRPGERLSF